jgi:hypothetical protein
MSRETGAERHHLTGAMNDKRDRVIGTFYFILID